MNHCRLLSTLGLIVSFTPSPEIGTPSERFACPTIYGSLARNVSSISVPWHLVCTLADIHPYRFTTARAVTSKTRYRRYQSSDGIVYHVNLWWKEIRTALRDLSLSFRWQGLLSHRGHCMSHGKIVWWSFREIRIFYIFHLLEKINQIDVGELTTKRIDGNGQPLWCGKIESYFSQDHFESAWGHLYSDSTENLPATYR